MRNLLPLNTIFRSLFNKTYSFKYVGDIIDTTFLTNSKKIGSLKIVKSNLYFTNFKSKMPSGASFRSWTNFSVSSPKLFSCLFVSRKPCSMEKSVNKPDPKVFAYILVKSAIKVCGIRILRREGKYHRLKQNREATIFLNIVQGKTSLIQS